MKAADILQQGDPLQLFEDWFAEVQANKQILEPTAMTLATSSKTGEPSARTVLLKQFTPEAGFAFFTNYESDKGRALIENPQAALLFFWASLSRQVKVRGPIGKTTRKESENYWDLRPRGSQIAGWLSQQSHPVPKGVTLDSLYEATEREFLGKPIPCPPHWGGFLLSPREIEFWIGRPNRLHERVRFTFEQSKWVGQQLFP